MRSLSLGAAVAALLFSFSAQAAELSPTPHHRVAVRHVYHTAWYSRLYDPYCGGPYVGSGYHATTYYGGPWIDLRCFGGPIY
jgi:hypothetical protein